MRSRPRWSRPEPGDSRPLPAAPGLRRHGGICRALPGGADRRAPRAVAGDHSARPAGAPQQDSSDTHQAGRAQARAARLPAGPDPLTRVDRPDPLGEPGADGGGRLRPDPPARAPTLPRQPVPIGPETTAPALTAELAKLGAALLVEVLADLERFPPAEPDHAAATLAPRLRKEDGELDWALPAAEIDRRVRGLDPWPGTAATLADRPLKVLRGRPAEGSGKPGEILRASADGLLVGTGSGAYLVEEVQLPSRRPMPARQLLP